MERDKGFTLIELLVVVALILGALLVLLPALAKKKELSRRTLCSANLTGIYKAAYTYSVTNEDSVPRYASTTTAGDIQAFRENYARDSTLSVTADMQDNATAALWILVRLGTTPTKIYICPSTKDKPDPLTTFTGKCKPTAISAPLDKTWDFACQDHISYSMLNPYHTIKSELWRGELSSARIFLSDDNNNDSPATTRHRHVKGESGLTQSIIEREENSTNHSQGEGQHLLWADSHVKFTTHPLVGISNDNVFAYDTSTSLTPEIAVPPTLANNAPGYAPMVDNRQSDDCMIPVTGNRGVNLASKIK